MKKFKVLGDPNNRPFCSSEIIISGLNNAAKKMDLYDENGTQVMYDCIANSHNQKVDAFICAYELTLPDIVLNNLGGKPFIGLSKSNMIFALDAGYDPNSVSYFNLGVDSNTWVPQEKRFMKDKFVVLSAMDSNSRSGILHVIHAFGGAFKGNKGAVLYLKDREATPKFKEFVQKMALVYNIEIVHDDRHIANYQDQLDIYAHADIFISLNYSSTFSMTVSQALSCQIPVVCMAYSGPADFLVNGMNAVCPSFALQEVTDEFVNELQGVGFKNHLFSRSHYAETPYWAIPNIESVMKALLVLKDNKDMRERLGVNGRKTAELLTWEKSALNLSQVLSEFKSKGKID